MKFIPDVDGPFSWLVDFMPTEVLPTRHSKCDFSK